MTVADFIYHLGCGTQNIYIGNRHRYCYFEGAVADLTHKSPVKLRKVRDLSVLEINATVSHGEAWVNIIVAD